MSKFKNYIVLVDCNKKPSMQRNTHGRYIVGAKNKKQAKELTQKRIGFGSVQVYRELEKIIVPYKSVMVEKTSQTGDTILTEAKHANNSKKKKLTRG